MAGVEAPQRPIGTEQQLQNYNIVQEASMVAQQAERNAYGAMEIPIYSQTQEDREKQANQFGAFLQVFVKKKDAQGIPRVSCMSYPLPAGVTEAHATDMLSRILGTASSTEKQYYRSESGDLQFMAQEGATFDNAMLGRFLQIPGKELGIDQAERERDLIDRGVLKEFQNGLTGKRHESAKASKGENIFAFSYRVGDGLYGKNVKGVEGKKMSELAVEGAEEHKDILVALEDVLMNMEEGVAFKIDKSKYVSKCCALFFKEKLVGGARVIREKVKSFMSQFIGTQKAYALDSEDACDDCGLEKNSCSCSVKDATVQELASGE